MDIRFVSSLTPEDESRVAAILCAAIAGMLDELSIAYTIRIETADGRTFHRCSTLETPRTAADIAPTPGPIVES